jgi:hypothetical protein
MPHPAGRPRAAEAPAVANEHQDETMTQVEATTQDLRDLEDADAAAETSPAVGDVQGPAADNGEPRAVPAGAGAARALRHAEPPQNLYDKIEAFVSRLSVRDNFWNSICSLIWLPLAFFSGIRLKAVDSATKAFDSATRSASGAVSSAVTSAKERVAEKVASSKIAAAAVLPFRRFNRNWYRAMAGGALLANSEIAGGMYVFGIVGGDYTVVCKHLEYRFLRPCLGPAVYRMTPRENVHERVTTGGEFNVTLDMDITQQASRMGERDKRVGQCVATFHVTPKVQHKTKRLRNKGR